jgi:hypothetical protein
VIDPQLEYSQRLEARQRVRDARHRAHIRIGNSKLIVIVFGAILAWFCLSRNTLSPAWIAAPVLIYLVLAILHAQILRDLNRADRAVSFYQRGLDRIADRWSNAGETGDAFRDDQHVYSSDLDLFGRGSLFQLLSSARLPMGEARLASWLTAPSDLPSILARHEMVAELRDKLDLREHVAVIGAELRLRLDPDQLVTWSERTPALPWPALRIVWATLVIGFFVTVALGFHNGVWWPLFAVLLIELLSLILLLRRAAVTIEGAAASVEALRLFAQVLQKFEGEKFSSPRLQALMQGHSGPDALSRAADSAPRSLRQLSRIVAWIDGREGLFAKLIEWPTLYTIEVAYFAEAWRRRCGKLMRGWIETTGEMEALLSLATYAFEHPADPLPTFVEPQDGRAILHGENLGHPLIPATACVRNSVRLDHDVPVLLVSGSNMSGKSTYLRAVGINTVLAMAGAPVRATSLSLTPLALGTRLRTPDSLQEGRSGFYSEVLRIKQVFDLTPGPLPVLFLFDELLEGTNSKDRKIGAQNLIAALLRRGAIGIATTHDLALTAIAPALGDAMRNVHFEDHIEGGEMRFDYILRDGVVTKSNAIALMRLIGLDV